MENKELKKLEAELKENLRAFHKSINPLFSRHYKNNPMELLIKQIQQDSHKHLSLIDNVKQLQILYKQLPDETKKKHADVVNTISNALLEVQQSKKFTRER